MTNSITKSIHQVEKEGEGEKTTMNPWMNLMICTFSTGLDLPERASLNR